MSTLPYRDGQTFQALCQQANQLLSDKRPASAEDFHSLLNDLAIYTREHFAAQEKWLRESNSPLLEQHRNKHILYESQLTDILLSASLGILDKDGLCRFMRECESLHPLQAEPPIEET